MKTQQTQQTTITNAQLLAAYDAMRRVGESNSKDRELAKKFARILLILEAKLRLFQTARNNLLRSNAVRDEKGEIVYQDQHQQSPRMRWEFQSAMADLENDTVTFRCEKISDADLEEVRNANTLAALNPLLECSLAYAPEEE